jgi:hypothetical protein
VTQPVRITYHGWDVLSFSSPLLDSLAAAQQAGELRTDRPVELLALAIWSTMHGLTALLSDYLSIDHIDHLLVEHNAVSSREKVDQLMAHVIQMTTQGLMVPS